MREKRGRVRKRHVNLFEDQYLALLQRANRESEQRNERVTISDVVRRILDEALAIGNGKRKQ